MSPLTTKQAEEAREIGREIAEQLTPPHGTTLIQTQAEPKRDRRARGGGDCAGTGQRGRHCLGVGLRAARGGPTNQPAFSAYLWGAEACL